MIEKLEKTYYELENNLDNVFKNVTKDFKEMKPLTTQIIAYYYNSIYNTMSEYCIIGYSDNILYEKTYSEINMIDFKGFTTIDKIYILNEIIDEINRTNIQ